MFYFLNKQIYVAVGLRIFQENRMCLISILSLELQLYTHLYQCDN